MRPWVTCYTKSGRIKFTKEQWMEGSKRLSLDQKFLHRLDGPAVIYSDGEGYYWIDGEGYKEDKFRATIAAVKRMSLAERLTDPRDWVRELKGEPPEEMVWKTKRKAIKKKI
jgi:hypothetical protein